MGQIELKDLAMQYQAGLANLDESGLLETREYRLGRCEGIERLIKDFYGIQGFDSVTQAIWAVRGQGATWEEVHEDPITKVLKVVSRAVRPGEYHWDYRVSWTYAYDDEYANDALLDGGQQVVDDWELVGPTVDQIIRMIPAPGITKKITITAVEPSEEEV